ncbi:cytochrome P450 [Nonomuraea sp. NPDC050394]|uniref:cytochrome P450 n=1 Tax=Nonomuraea sp. NPDC050394 TaxID=3364363 RepID=UPI00378C8B29
MADFEHFPFPSGPRGAPSDRYAIRREKEPLGLVQVPSGDHVHLATRYEDAAMVLTDPRFSRDLSYPGAPRMFGGFTIAEAPGGLIGMDPPDHTRLRRLLSGTFTPRQVNGWRPRLRELATDLADRLPATFDFVTEFAFPLPVQVICDVMGVPGIDSERVRRWSDAMLSSSGLTEEEKAGSAAEFYAYCATMIAEHRDAPGDGLLASMIEARDDGDRLTEDELVRMTLGLFLAGHETTGSILSRAALRLLAPRDGFERLVADPGVIPQATEELFRVEQPGDSPLIRVATEDVDLPSGPIRKGEGVIASFAGANFDPGVFTSPATMDFDRAAGQPHLAFGRGAHYCLGANLARAEVREFLGVLAARMPGLRLAVPAEEVEWTVGSIMVRPLHLPVRK